MEDVLKTYRLFSIICYDDSDNLNFYSIISKLSKSNYSYFAIKHDNDNVKTHYHIAIYSRSACYINTISKFLDVPSNYISISDDTGSRYTLKKTIGYLLHYNNKEKYNYSYEDITTNDSELLGKYYNLLTGNNVSNFSEIYSFIKDTDNVNLFDVTEFCIINNYLSDLKKYQYLIIQLINSKR